MMNHKYQPIWIGLGLIGLMGVTLFFGFRQHPTPFDDAYITYRYARNIAMGRGFVFNAGETVLGTTTPLYTLLLAGLSRIWPDIPRLSHAISVLAWTISVPVTYGIGQADGRKVVGLIAAAFVALNTLLLNALGMETALYVLLALLTFYWYLKEQPIWASFFAGLAFLTRWDGILVVGVLLLAELLKNRKNFLRAAIVCALIILPWLAYSYLTFGSIFPNSFYAKAGQGWNQELGGEEIGTFAQGLLAIAKAALARNSLFIFFPFLGVLGAFSAFRRRVIWWPLLLWTAAYFAGFTVLGVLRFDWYYPPLIPAVALLTAEGIDYLAGFADRRLGPRARTAALAGLCLLCVIPAVHWLASSQRRAVNAYTATYIEAGEWLQENTPADSTVAMIEIGILGYYSDRAVVDTMGLVSPEMTGHLESWLQTLRFAINHYWPDYVVALERTAWDGIIHEPWFIEAYTWEASIDSRAKPLAIYRRRETFPIREFALSTGQEVRFGDDVFLSDFQLAEDRLQPGENLHVQLNWEALADIDDDYRLSFELIHARDGQSWPAAGDLQPMRGGNPTYQWRAGDAVADAHTLPIPEDIPAGPYALRLSVRGEDGPLPIFDATGAPASYAGAGPLWVGVDSLDAPGPNHPVQAVFAENIQLQGYDLEITADNQLWIGLAWEAEEEISKDYTVFVHLMAPTGELVAQSDSLPRLPTSAWLPNIPVSDEHLLALPGDYIGQEYEIRIGLYQWPELERMPIVSAGCTDTANDALLVGHISFADGQTANVQSCFEKP